MKNFLKMAVLYSLIINTSLLSAQTTQGAGTSIGGGVANFNTGVGIGPATDVPFTPGTVNNHSGHTAPEDVYRNVYWLHGLNGDIGSWVRASTASEFNVANGFPARKLHSFSNFTYTQTGGLLDASAQAGTWIRCNQDNEPSRDFMIAHSQGGLVGRGLLYLDYCTLPQTTPPFGGLVTFCTPHQGAMILNNHKQLGILAEEMCQDLNDGPLLEKLNDFKVWGLPLPQRLKKKVLVTADVLCSDFKDFVFPLVENKQLPNITKDYLVGSPLLQRMDLCADGNPELGKFPKVAFYGVEPKDHLMLRTLLYFAKSSQEADYFEANDDQELIKDFNENYSKYLEKYLVSNLLYEFHASEYYSMKCHTLLRYYSPECIISRKNMMLYFDLKEAWKRGLDFMDRMDDQYKSVIGALEYKPETKLYCECYDKQTGEKTRTPIQSPGDCKVGNDNGTFCDVYEETVFNRVEYDSDGVVLASSASNLPAATFPPQSMINSSHMQARNNDQLRTGLDKLFEGDTDPFFKTARK